MSICYFHNPFYPPSLLGNPLEILNAFYRIGGEDSIPFKICSPLSPILPAHNKNLKPSIPNVRAELEQKQAAQEAELKAVDKQIANLTNSLAKFEGDGMESFVANIKHKAKDLEAPHADVTASLQALTAQLKALPDAEEMEQRRQALLNLMVKGKSKRERRDDELMQGHRTALATSPQAFFSLPFAEQKRLVNFIFGGGKDENGKRYGIYVKITGKHHKDANVEFEPHGKLITFEGWAQPRERYGTYESTGAPQELVETVGKAIVKNKPGLMQSKAAKNGQSVNAPS